MKLHSFGRDRFEMILIPPFISIHDSLCYGIISGPLLLKRWKMESGWRINAVAAPLLLSQWPFVSHDLCVHFTVWFDSLYQFSICIWSHFGYHLLSSIGVEKRFRARCCVHSLMIHWFHSVLNEPSLICFVWNILSFGVGTLVPSVSVWRGHIWWRHFACSLKGDVVTLCAVLNPDSPLGVIFHIQFRLFCPYL